jgi:hypothetical protein
VRRCITPAQRAKASRTARRCLLRPSGTPKARPWCVLDAVLALTRDLALDVPRDFDGLEPTVHFKRWRLVPRLRAYVGRLGRAYKLFAHGDIIHYSGTSARATASNPAHGTRKTTDLKDGPTRALSPACSGSFGWRYRTSSADSVCCDITQRTLDHRV